MENKKPIVWLFHEINDEIMQNIKNVSKKNPNDILSFDDGLYSNFMYLEELKKLPNKKIFFISLGIIRPNNKKPCDEFITCSEAHNQTDTKYYMSTDEINTIEHLDKKYNCFIGLHGVQHLKCSFKGDLINRITRPKISLSALGTSGTLINGIKDCTFAFREEIEQMFLLSDILLEEKVKYFAWPYNIENSFMKNILINKARTLNIELELFGKNRIEWESNPLTLQGTF